MRQEAERLVGLDVGLDGGAQRAEPVGGGIARGEDGENARALQGVVCVNGGDACVRMRRPNEDGVGDAIEPQIIEISAVAGDETGVLSPARGVANDGAIGHGWRLLGLPGMQIGQRQGGGQGPL